ncbi:PLDc N-terminal domain-containing protein [Pedobacter anseongensis]|uniref:PLDc N-terminal domain-containing protein n=1 Tax=Pedobacter anseongensis TaxID=3133439 RepID=UPI003D71654B
MQLLEFLNLGGAEVILLLLIGAPFLLTIYCIIDIIRSDFKESNTKLLFLILVGVLPFIGSVAYLFLKRNYSKQQPFKY